MTNNKQQTAVEWFGMEMGKLFAQYHGKIICIGEFHKKRFELENQAKEMEKEQMIESYRSGRIDQQNNAESNYNRMSEEHYKQTYGGGNK